MKTAPPFLNQTYEIDKLHSVVSKEYLWGRRICLLDASLLSLGHVMNQWVDGAPTRIRPRQHSPSKTKTMTSLSKPSRKKSVTGGNEIGEKRPRLLEHKTRHASIDPELEQPTSDKSIGFDDFLNRNKRAKSASGTILPLDFEPLPYSVVVGNVKKSRKFIGNERLRVLASTYLTRYAAAFNNRKAKSALVSKLVGIIREACPVGAFIKFEKDDGRWYAVSDAVAREKVGYTFRELLGDQYRSSSKAKATMRSLKRRVPSLQKSFNFDWRY